MKKILFAILVTLMITVTMPFIVVGQTITNTPTTTTAPAPTATASTTGEVKAGFLSMGQDNIYAWIPGEGAFLAVGGGFDVISWEKDIGAKGGKLNLILHPYAAARVTGSDTGAIVGTSVNVDLIKLFNGTGVKFLLDNFKCVIGPTMLYDANMGKMGYGGLLNFSYTITP